MVSLEIFNGDISQLKVDAIVNAANSTLMGGGGVDGAIHKAAGPGLLYECKTLGGCAAGEAKLTSGYNLPAKWIIHTVGPVWHGGNNNEEVILERCYENCLRIAIELNTVSIAFPNISTGIYNFPKDLAALIAVNTVRRIMKKSEIVQRVIFAIFDKENLEIYNNLLQS